MSNVESPNVASKGLARWAGSMSVLQGLLLFVPLTVLGTTVELLGMDASSLIFLGTTVVQLWFLATGIWLLVRGGRPSTSTLGS